jgi:hypothetical protein
MQGLGDKIVPELYPPGGLSGHFTVVRGTSLWAGLLPRPAAL